MIRVACLLAVLAAPAAAQSLCEVLDQHDGDVLALSQGTAHCDTSLALGGTRNVHCVLEFAYRSEGATRAFEALVAEVTACIGPAATITLDQSVNHPDAYDLREFEEGGRSYAVSIKDKGALQQTLVFVRVSRP
jgi:hypothetical protein